MTANLKSESRLSVGSLAMAAMRIAPALGAFIATLVLVGLLLIVLGANPFAAYKGMVVGALGNKAGLSATLLVAAPLLLVSIAVAIPFSARVFNIGANGQMIAGGVSATAAIFWLPEISPAIVVVIAIVSAVIGGGVWGAIAGALTAYRGANEVIVTLMMNFVALLLAAYVTSGPWNNPMGPQTKDYPAGVQLPGAQGFNIGIAIALLGAVIAYLLMFRSKYGFAIRAVGFNKSAARKAGYNPRRVTMSVMWIAGGFAGIAGAIEVLGNYGALVADITSEYGFTGIAVALIAGLRPLALIPAAFFFAVIKVGSNTLPATTGVSSATSSIVLATLVIILLALHIVRVPTPEAQ